MADLSIYTLRGKKKFIRSFVNSVADALVARLENGHRDEIQDWNGIELRELVCDAFERERPCRSLMPRGRLIKYRNVKACNNL